MNELKDIKDIVDVPEYSLFLLIGVIFLTLLLLSLAIYFFKNRRKRRKKLTPKEIALQKLHAIKYHNTKEMVYSFEAHARLFIDENNQASFQAIKKALEIYKYKKDIPELDSKIKADIEAFIKGLK